jgi:hypothetical protein
MDIDRHLITGCHRGQHNSPAAGSHAEIGRLLAHLAQRLAERWAAVHGLSRR